MYKKVLVPLDGSEVSECSLGEVKSLFNAGVASEIILLNIVKIDIPWAVEGIEIDVNTIRNQVQASAKKYLASVKAHLAAEGIRVITVISENNRPSEAIIEYACKNNIDLIIMATHGYTGIKKVLVGSVATGVLNHSPVPVLLVRPESCQS
jgi:nucleotide-binding universal stress UspA family protein